MVGYLNSRSANLVSSSYWGRRPRIPKQRCLLPTDWSHQHLIFSRPATVEQAERVQQDPRYWQQLRRHTLAKLPEAETSDAFTSGLRPIRVKIPLRDTNHELKPDWSEDLGGGGTVGAGNYPAKYTLTTLGVPAVRISSSIAPVLSPVRQRPASWRYDNLYAGCGATVPSVYWAYNTKGQILTSPVFSRDGKQVAFAQIAAAKASLVLLKWAASAAETISSPRRPYGCVSGVVRNLRVRRPA